jgi:hypothetical protein
MLYECRVNFSGGIFMEFCVTNNVCTITATTEINNFTLRSCANGTLIAEHKFPGMLTGMALDGETLLCAVEYDAQAEYKYDTKVLHSFTTRVVQVYTFNMKLEELSCDFETNSVCQHLLSCMDKSAVYTVQWDVGSTGIEDDNGIFRPFDEIGTLIFSRHDLKTCKLTTWKLDDFENDSECSEALEKVISGYATGINRISVSDGKLMLECSVFEPDSVIEPDAPKLDNDDYVEYHSFPSTVCVDLDTKELSCVVDDH